MAKSARLLFTRMANLIFWPGFTLTIRRKSLFDVQNSIDPSGIFTLYTSDTCKVPPLAVVRRSLFGRSPSPKIPRRTLGHTTLDPARACRDTEKRGGPPGRPLLFTPVTPVPSVVPWPGTVGSYRASLASLNRFGSTGSCCILSQVFGNRHSCRASGVLLANGIEARHRVRSYQESILRRLRNRWVQGASLTESCRSSGRSEPGKARSCTEMERDSPN